MCPYNLRKTAHPELKIYTINLISARKGVNKHTDQHTKNLKLCRTTVQTLQENFQKI